MRRFVCVLEFRRFHAHDMHSLKKTTLGARTFFASCHARDTCGNNGLPLTPNSIRVLGLFQLLKCLTHNNLCTYIDAFRSKHERLVVVIEHFRNSLQDEIPNKLSVYSISRICRQVLEALDYLHRRGIVHRALSPCSILLDDKQQVKLANYGLCHMTENGRTVPFPLGTPKYLAPEVLTRERPSLSGPKADIWSLGVITLELALGQEVWKGASLEQIFTKLLTCIKEDGDALLLMVDSDPLNSKLEELDPSLKSFISSCLKILPRERPSAQELLRHSLVTLAGEEVPSLPMHLEHMPLRCESLAPLKCAPCFGSPLEERPLQELYSLWRLAGGDAEAELRRQGCLRAKPPICTLPCIVLLEGEELGQKKDTVFFYDDTVVLLPTEQLCQRLKGMDPNLYYPLIEEEDVPAGPSSSSDTAALPVIIREKDIEYQLQRVILYNRLLEAYPYQKQRIIQEAKLDIPPLYRAHIWSALLDVQGALMREYEAIDKETTTPTDRQIEVDIPRCHQYDELLSSPTAHAKFKRLLKAWVVSHPHYVYWQGLDSLCAPFLYLHFNDEASAYACLSTFISRYLYDFFLQDNSQVIKEYLAVFSHLVAFHDPELTNHLDSIGFLPELYSIPWFLTMYTHVFPLHKIFHLWDTLLLGRDSFPLCVGVAILQQLRTDLLSFGFNECILLFSDMPEIDIQRCVQDSIRIFCSTPQSSTFRAHARPGSQPQDPLGMSPVPLEELKAELCPRISPRDLLDLLEMSRRDSSKLRLLVIDVRPPDEYQRGTVPGALNVLPTHLGEPALQGGCMVVVAGSLKDHTAAVSAANGLVRSGQLRVCLLHGGIEALRSLLELPPPRVATHQ
ncbi:TBC domain-containing protein kinase-like protein isoform X2 [Dermacentor variabilis]|uniref:TBC domain-containing protein kinase-like protein isoform X2 n=1 Tax=Dermacentor variabilis TaxID=34621 RepID=UPI003F5B1E87